MVHRTWAACAYMYKPPYQSSELSTSVIQRPHAEVSCCSLSLFTRPTLVRAMSMVGAYRKRKARRGIVFHLCIERNAETNGMFTCNLCYLTKSEAEVAYISVVTVRGRYTDLSLLLVLQVQFIGTRRFARVQVLIRPRSLCSTGIKRLGG